jgi:hypothetical protein
LGPLDTAATNRPTVPTSGDYDDGDIGGIMIGSGNRSTRRKPVPNAAFFYLVCEAIGTAATPGVLSQPRVIVKMSVE